MLVVIGQVCQVPDQDYASNLFVIMMLICEDMVLGVEYSCAFDAADCV